MSQLQWTRRETGWRAGRYSIELLAPGIWILSRIGPSGDPEIVESSAFRSVLIAAAADRESRRLRRRRVAAWTAVFASIQVMDAMVERTWESIKNNYQ
jgi:hypothetical protein